MSADLDIPPFLDRRERGFHALAEPFPLMEGQPFDDLVADIRENDLQEPIWLYEGLILDGRNRYRACKEAGVTPKYREYAGDDPVRFVISLNLHRRHLNESQRAWIAAKFATAKSGQRNDLAPKETRSPKAMTNAEAAKMFNVGHNAVSSAKTVQQRGTEEEKAAVERGERKVTPLAKDIRAGVPPKERKKVDSRPAPKRAPMRFWVDLRDGLDKINGLPQAADVVPQVHYAARADLGRKVDLAITWLQTFKQEWESHGQGKAETESGSNRHVRLEDPPDDAEGADAA